MDERIRVVADGYDAMADRYAAWRDRIDDPSRDAWLGRLEGALPAGSDVLELGCGDGLPTAVRIAARHRYTGIDVSAAQLARARTHLPQATLIRADMTTVDLPPDSFDAVIALYSINHVPRERHGDLFHAIASWLRPGGRLVAAVGGYDDAGWRGPWLDVPMFFAGWSPSRTHQLLTEAGFVIDEKAVIDLNEPEGPTSFLWVFAHRG